MQKMEIVQKLSLRLVLNTNKEGLCGSQNLVKEKRETEPLKRKRIEEKTILTFANQPLHWKTLSKTPEISKKELDLKKVLTLCSLDMIYCLEFTFFKEVKS